MHPLVASAGVEYLAAIGTDIRAACCAGTNPFGGGVAPYAAWSFLADSPKDETAFIGAALFMVFCTCQATSFSM